MIEHTVEIDSDVLASQIMDNNVQRFVCVGIKPVRGDTLVFTNQGHELATAVVSGVDTVELRPTDMSLNGRQLFSIIHDRYADLTDNEFAAECGFEGYMELVSWAHNASERPWHDDAPVQTVCVRWSS